MQTKSWSLSLQFEYHHSSIMTSCKHIECWMSSNSPEPVRLTTMRIYCRPRQGTARPHPLMEVPFWHVPDPYWAVLWITNNEILSWMKYNTRYIVIMTSTSINLPGLGIWGREGENDDICTLWHRLLHTHTQICMNTHTHTQRDISKVIITSTCSIPFILHSLTCLSSAAETKRGREGWKLTQLTPLSWPCVCVCMERIK